MTDRVTPIRYARPITSASVPATSQPLATLKLKAAISYNRKPFYPLPIADRCHQEAYSQWRQALHSNSFRTPFYRTSVDILARTKGIEFTRHCDSCHNPIGVLSGALTQNSKVDRGFDEDGLTCTTCHSIQQLRSTNGNAGFLMGVPSVMVDEVGRPIPGFVSDDEIRNHPDRHSRAVMKDFYRHNQSFNLRHGVKANLPETLNDYKFIRCLRPYTMSGKTRSFRSVIH